MIEYSYMYTGCYLTRCSLSFATDDTLEGGIDRNALGNLQLQLLDEFCRETSILGIPHIRLGQDVSGGRQTALRPQRTKMFRPVMAHLQHILQASPFADSLEILHPAAVDDKIVLLV
jgi:hypothetical protein